VLPPQESRRKKAVGAAVAGHLLLPTSFPFGRPLKSISGPFTVVSSWLLFSSWRYFFFFAAVFFVAFFFAALFFAIYNHLPSLFHGKKPRTKNVTALYTRR
jgi:hypothetical protein